MYLALVKKDSYHREWHTQETAAGKKDTSNQDAAAQVNDFVSELIVSIFPDFKENSYQLQKACVTYLEKHSADEKEAPFSVGPLQVVQRSLSIAKQRFMELSGEEETPFNTEALMDDESTPGIKEKVRPKPRVENKTENEEILKLANHRDFRDANGKVVFAKIAKELKMTENTVRYRVNVNLQGKIIPDLMGVGSSKMQEYLADKTLQAQKNAENYLVYINDPAYRYDDGTVNLQKVAQVMKKTRKDITGFIHKHKRDIQEIVGSTKKGLSRIEQAKERGDKTKKRLLELFNDTQYRKDGKIWVAKIAQITGFSKGFIHAVRREMLVKHLTPEILNETL